MPVEGEREIFGESEAERKREEDLDWGQTIHRREEREINLTKFINSSVLF